MADNVNITAGAGVVIATESESDVHYQKIKLTASGTGTTEDLTKAEDSAHASGHHGIMALTVRQDAAAALGGTDADYQPLVTDANGRLHTLDANSASMLTALQLIDDAVAADAQAYGKGILCQGDDGTDRRAILVGTDGHVQVDVLSGGGGTEYTEDVATANPIVGLATMMERDDIIAALTPVEGDWASLRCSAEGALWVQDFNSDASLALLGTIDTDTGVIAGDTTSIDGKITACNTGAVVLATGSAAIGKLATNTGVDIGDVDVTSVIPGVAATSLGKARDSALGATDTGVMALAVRDDTLTTLTPVDGDYVPLRVGSTGALHVTVSNITACNTGAVVVASGAITETNSASLAVVGGGAEATALRVTIANDSTGVVTIDGTVTANLSATDNAVLDTIDAVLDTIDADTGAIKTAIEIVDDWDATHASAAVADGPQIMGAGYSTGLPADVGADADAARICTDRYGRVLAGLMPQNFQATFTSADATSAAPVKVKTADRKMYILSLVVSVDTAMNVQFQDDTGPTVLIEGMYFAANGGAHLTWPPEAPLIVNTNEDFDVIASAAGNISVTITGYLAV